MGVYRFTLVPPAAPRSTICIYSISESSRNLMWIIFLFKWYSLIINSSYLLIEHCRTTDNTFDLRVWPHIGALLYFMWITRHLFNFITTAPKMMKDEKTGGSPTTKNWKLRDIYQHPLDGSGGLRPTRSFYQNRRVPCSARNFVLLKNPIVYLNPTYSFTFHFNRAI